MVMVRIGLFRDVKSVIIACEFTIIEDTLVKYQRSSRGRRCAFGRIPRLMSEPGKLHAAAPRISTDTCVYYRFTSGRVAMTRVYHSLSDAGA
jgi:hypothetical protein